MTMTTDALHTVRETAREGCARGHCYVFEVKVNQPQLLVQLRTEYKWSGRCHRTVDCNHVRIETREIRDSS